ncbi:hypothetical protein [Bacillus sp. D386]|uniref:hypothetical protein n=1 Tax=Bacillus sp. D386 TaxID=2587155 RepID=UPI00111EDFBA|nr:hypothetical protein [Bacillus sp. D386]
MDGTLLSNSIYSLKGADLRIIYSLLTNLNLKELIPFNFNKIISRKHNTDYVNCLLEKTDEYIHLSDEALQVSLFQEMNKTLELEGVYYSEAFHVDNQCEEIVEKVYQIYINQEKSFLQNTEQIEFTRIHHIIHYQLRQLFYEVEYRFQNLSVEDQQDFLNTIYEFIIQLSEDEKWILLQQLPANYLSIEVFKEIELSTLLIQVSNISLPSFFDMFTKLLMNYNEKLPMNIPLINQENISPTTKLLTSPYFITPYVLGGRVLQINYQHRAIKKRLMPFILMQITLAYLCDENSVSSPVLFLNEWKRRVEEYRQLEYHSDLLEMKHIEMSSSVHKSRQRINEFANQKNHIQERLNIEMYKLKSTLLFMDINELTINQSFEKHRTEYIHIQKKLNQLAASKSNEILETSLIKQFTNKLLNMSVTLDQLGKEKKVDELLESLVRDILDSDSDFKRADRIGIKQIQKELTDIDFMIETENKIKSKYEKELIKLNQQLQECSDKVKQIENENYGIKEVAQSI